MSRVAPSFFALTFVACNAILGIQEQPVKSSPIEACAQDSDCHPPSGCYTPHCDLSLGVCAYGLCETGDSCSRAICDTKAGACGVTPAPYGFRSTQFPIQSASVGCSGDARGCFAAVYPFLFVGTAAGPVLAFSVADITSNTPQSITIEGLTFAPSRIVASGQRVYFIGDVRGTGAPYKVSLGWLDVPTNPATTALTATSVDLVYPLPNLHAFPAPAGALYVIANDMAKQYPAALLTAPLQDGASLAVAPAPGATYAMYPSSFPASSVPDLTFVSASGARIVAYRAPATFNLLTNAGTDHASFQPDLHAGAFDMIMAPGAFGAGPDGSLVWVVETATAIMATVPACVCAHYESSIDWILPDGSATALSAMPGTLTTKDTAQLPAVQCGVMACCAMTPCPTETFTSLAIGLTAQWALVVAKREDEKVYVEIANRAQSPPSLLSGRMSELAVNLDTDKVALAAANGFGYVLTADALGNKMNVGVFDPRCIAR